MPPIVDLKSGLDFESRFLTRQINEREDFATLIINSVNDGIHSYDCNLLYTLWNPAMERLTGMKAAHVLGRHAFEVFPYLKDGPLGENYLGALAGKCMRAEEASFLASDSGAEVWCLSMHRPLMNEEGQIVGGMGIVKDITAQVKTRLELDELNRYLERRIRSFL